MVDWSLVVGKQLKLVAHVLPIFSKYHTKLLYFVMFVQGDAEILSPKYSLQVVNIYIHTSL